MNVLRFRILIYLIVGMIDLITTLILVGSGRALEINPLASMFVGNPAQLVLFKTIVMSLIVLVAYRLARYSRMLAESAMAVAATVTMFVVACGLSTVKGPLKGG